MPRTREEAEALDFHREQRQKTKREEEELVRKMVDRGDSMREIAGRLGKSPEAVKQYLRRRGLKAPWGDE